MTRLICLEGPDGAGKSTLGKALTERLGVEVTHDGGPSVDVSHAMTRVTDFLGYKDTIRDRSTLFSDKIYKDALKKEGFLTQDQVDYGVALAAMRGTLLIYCRPPLDVLLKNAAYLAKDKPHKPASYVDEVKAMQSRVVESYDAGVRRWASLGLRVMRYDYTSTRIEEFVEDVAYYWDVAHL